MRLVWRDEFETLLDAHAEACRQALEACGDREAREYLSRWISSPPIVGIGGVG